MDRKILFLILFTFVFSFSASAYHGDSFSGYNGYGSGLDYFDRLDQPREVITGFVAPFLLIAVLFQRGYEKALSFSWADDANNHFPAQNQRQERKKIKKFSLIMSLSTSAIIVPTPWFQLIRYWVANLFSLIGIVFFAAIFVAFIWVVWKGLS